MSIFDTLFDKFVELKTWIYKRKLEKEQKAEVNKRRLEMPEKLYYEQKYNKELSWGEFYKLRTQDRKRKEEIKIHERKESERKLKKMQKGLDKLSKLGGNRKRQTNDELLSDMGLKSNNGKRKKEDYMKYIQ